MSLTDIKYCKLGEVVEVIGFRSHNLLSPIQKDMLGIHRFIIDADHITYRIKNIIPPTIWALNLDNAFPLLEDYLKFLFDSGIFYTRMIDIKGSHLPIHVLKSDLLSYKIPIVKLDIQIAISKLEQAWEWSKENINTEFKYSGLRVALLDEIKHLIAIELYFPEKLHELNIKAIDSLMDFEGLSLHPEQLFYKLILDQPSIMSQIKRFRTIIFRQ